MADLTGLTPASTFKFLTQCPGGLDASLTTIQDGGGISGPYQISTAKVSFLTGKTLELQSGSTFTALAGSTVNLSAATVDVFDQDLNTTDAVDFASVTTTGNVIINGPTLGVNADGTSNTDITNSAITIVGPAGSPPKLELQHTDSTATWRFVPTATGDLNLNEVGVATQMQFMQGGDLLLFNRLELNLGTALTTDLNTVLSGSQIGEAKNVQLKFGVDSGSTFDLNLVEGTNTTKGLFNHNQVGGASSNGAWNLFPKDSSISYVWDDTRFGPSAGAFTTSLGTASQPWFDLNFDGTLNDVSDERFKENIVRNPSDDQLQTNGISVGDMKTICKSVDLAIFTMIGKDICKYGIIAQDLIAEAAKIGVTEDQLVKSSVLKKHFEYETEIISEQVQEKETEEVEVEYDDFTEANGKLVHTIKTRTEQREKTVVVQVFDEQGSAAKVKETRTRTVEKEVTDKRGKKSMKDVKEKYEVDVDMFVKRPVMKTVTKTYEKFTDVVKEYKYTIDYQHFIRWRLL
ncbi:MAG: hypothetical protein V3R25_05840 [Nitrosomonadaceae bacterium]